MHYCPLYKGQNSAKKVEHEAHQSESLNIDAESDVRNKPTPSFLHIMKHKCTEIKRLYKRMWLAWIN